MKIICRLGIRGVCSYIFLLALRRLRYHVHTIVKVDTCCSSVSRFNIFNMASFIFFLPIRSLKMRWLSHLHSYVFNYRTEFDAILWSWRNQDWNTEVNYCPKQNAKIWTKRIYEIRCSASSGELFLLILKKNQNNIRMKSTCILKRGYANLKYIAS